MAGSDRSGPPPSDARGGDALAALLEGLHGCGLKVGADDAARIARVFRHAAAWSRARRVRALQSLIGRTDEERRTIAALAPYLFIDAPDEPRAAQFMRSVDTGAETAAAGGAANAVLTQPDTDTEIPVPLPPPVRTWRAHVRHLLFETRLPLVLVVLGVAGLASPEFFWIELNNGEQTFQPEEPPGPNQTEDTGLLAEFPPPPKVVKRWEPPPPPDCPVEEFKPPTLVYKVGAGASGLLCLLLALIGLPFLRQFLNIRRLVKSTGPELYRFERDGEALAEPLDAAAVREAAFHLSAPSVTAEADWIDAPATIDSAVRNLGRVVLYRDVWREQRPILFIEDVSRSMAAWPDHGAQIRKALAAQGADTVAMYMAGTPLALSPSRDMTQRLSLDQALANMSSSRVVVVSDAAAIDDPSKAQWRASLKNAIWIHPAPAELWGPGARALAKHLHVVSARSEDLFQSGRPRKDADQPLPRRWLAPLPADRKVESQLDVFRVALGEATFAWLCAGAVLDRVGALTMRSWWRLRADGIAAPRWERMHRALLTGGITLGGDGTVRIDEPLRDALITAMEKEAPALLTAVIDWAVRRIDVDLQRLPPDTSAAVAARAMRARLLFMDVTRREAARSAMRALAQEGYGAFVEASASTEEQAEWKVVVRRRKGKHGWPAMAGCGVSCLLAIACLVFVRVDALRMKFAHVEPAFVLLNGETVSPRHPLHFCDTHQLGNRVRIEDAQSGEWLEASAAKSWVFTMLAEHRPLRDKEVNIGVPLIVRYDWQTSNPLSWIITPSSDPDVEVHTLWDLKHPGTLIIDWSLDPAAPQAAPFDVQLRVGRIRGAGVVFPGSSQLHGEFPTPSGQLSLPVPPPDTFDGFWVRVALTDAAGRHYESNPIKFAPPGTLSLDGPSGVDVTILSATSQQFADKVPNSVRLPAGDYTVSWSVASCGEKQQNVTVQSGTVTHVPITLDCPCKPPLERCGPVCTLVNDKNPFHYGQCFQLAPGLSKTDAEADRNWPVPPFTTKSTLQGYYRAYYEWDTVKQALSVQLLYLDSIWNRGEPPNVGGKVRLTKSDEIAVLSGSPKPPLVRIAIQCIEGNPPIHLWAATLDSDFREIAGSAIQDLESGSTAPLIAPWFVACEAQAKAHAAQALSDPKATAPCQDGEHRCGDACVSLTSEVHYKECFTVAPWLTEQEADKHDEPPPEGPEFDYPVRHYYRYHYAWADDHKRILVRFKETGTRWNRGGAPLFKSDNEAPSWADQAGSAATDFVAMCSGEKALFYGRSRGASGRAVYSQYPTPQKSDSREIKAWTSYCQKQSASSAVPISPRPAPGCNGPNQGMCGDLCVSNLHEHPLHYNNQCFNVAPSLDRAHAAKAAIDPPPFQTSKRLVEYTYTRLAYVWASDHQSLTMHFASPSETDVNKVPPSLRISAADLNRLERDVFIMHLFTDLALYCDSDFKPHFDYSSKVRSDATLMPSGWQWSKTPWDGEVGDGFVTRDSMPNAQWPLRDLWPWWTRHCQSLKTPQTKGTAP